jgi:cobalt-zinc-cadmium resistance protein CzcA
MLERLVLSVIKIRRAIVALLIMLLGAGVYAGATLSIDAMPDVSPVQVSILTPTGGLSTVEAENTVSIPIENALNGIPGQVELRSLADAGVVSVTVIFKEGTNPYFARQLVIERLRGIEKELPPSAGVPSLAPLSTGLGEIYQFVVKSSVHSPMQLRTMLDWEIVPKLRSIPGITEINTQGGELKQYQVRVDPVRLHAQGSTLAEVVAALRSSNLSAGGGYLERGMESYIVRGEGMLRSEQEIGDVIIKLRGEQTPLRVSQVGDVVIGPALRYGAITHDGKGEAVAGTVMMLLGANSRDVVHAVGKCVKEIQAALPPGATIEVVYDRADFVGRTLTTVATNLTEGVLVVVVILAIFLGTLRGAVAVVLGIPAAMSVALIGMSLLHVTGDLMSLGAIDFGFLVDGPIVVLEAVIAGTAGRKLVGRARAGAYGELASATIRPVGFAVAIILLVYIPLLALEGVEGKMFRPMAITMALALFGALLYTVVFFPAVLAVLVTPRSDHGPKWLQFLERRYRRILPTLVERRVPILALAAIALVGAGYFFSRNGAEFVPRIFEGDAVVTIRRAPSISLSMARDLDLETERVLHRFPEVISTLGMTGRAEIAVDLGGVDATDILVRLRPIKEWKTADNFDDLSAIMKETIEREVLGTFVSISQPIEDRTNEIISGSRADVAIQIYGPELPVLARLISEVKDAVRSVSGIGDYRVERLMGQPALSAAVDRKLLAIYGVRLEDALNTLTATREGIDVGQIYEGARRFSLRVLEPPRSATREGLSELRVETMAGESVQLGSIMHITEEDGPTSVRRINRERVVRVDVNLRGRDLVSWVSEAQATVKNRVHMDSAYRVDWGGQFENFERAQARLKIVIPIVIAIIFGMLLVTFRHLGLAVAVFLTVPLALTGGFFGLAIREMPFSLSAAVGFIALGGVAVLNGVIMGQQVRRKIETGDDPFDAVVSGSVTVMRAVLITAAAAAFGFLPMAISTGAGAEVQQPLATAVAAGISIGALTTLVVLPGILYMFLRHQAPTDFREERTPAPVV